MLECCCRVSPSRLARDIGTPTYEEAERKDGFRMPKRLQNDTGTKKDPGPFPWPGSLLGSYRSRILFWDLFFRRNRRRLMGLSRIPLHSFVSGVAGLASLRIISIPPLGKILLSGAGEGKLFTALGTNENLRLKAGVICHNIPSQPPFTTSLLYGNNGSHGYGN